MGKTFNLELVTPARHVLGQAVEGLVCPGAEGSFGVLPGHVPMLISLKPGMLKLKTGKEEIIYALGGGFAEIGPQRVLILADTAELAEDIDIEAARREKERARAQLKKGVRGAEMDVAEISLKKALTRLSVADSARRRKSEKR